MSGPKPQMYEHTVQINPSLYRPTLSILDKRTETRTTNESSEETLMSAKKSLEELEERQFPQREPLWKVHPYYVPEDTRSVPPHESSVWPENRKHFDLVSSYDCMVGFLGIRGMAERDMAKSARKGN